MPPDSARCATGWHTPCSALHSTRGFARCRFRSQSPPPPPVEQQGAGAHHTDAPDATYEGALVGLGHGWASISCGTACLWGTSCAFCAARWGQTGRWELLMHAAPVPCREA